MTDMPNPLALCDADLAWAKLHIRFIVKDIDVARRIAAYEALAILCHNLAADCQREVRVLQRCPDRCECHEKPEDWRPER